MYFPRRCGRLSPLAFWSSWRWSETQRSLFPKYAAFVVASEHMRHEFVRSGADPAKIHVNGLFSTSDASHQSPAPASPHVMFLGRMTTLKGGELLLRAVAHASARIRGLHLSMAGEGPQRRDWEGLARRLKLSCTFTGWLDGDEKTQLLAKATILALPSIWPEPFGLVGLEAAALGVPAVATRSGGVGDWLQDGVNGVLVPTPATPRSFGEALAEVLGDRARLERLRQGAYRAAGTLSRAAHVDRLESLFRMVAPSQSV